MKMTQSGNNIALEIGLNVSKAGSVIKDALSVLAERSMLSVKDAIKDGKGTKFENMITKSPKATGRYSERYGDKRQRSAKPTEKVDLNFKGDLIADFAVLEQTDIQAVIGFKSEGQADLAEWQEAYYGFPIFDVGQDVIDRESAKFFEKIDKALGI